MTSAVILGMIVTMFPEPREQAKAIGVYAFVASAGGSVGLLAGGVLTQVDQLALDLLRQRADRHRDAPLPPMRLIAATRASASSKGADVPGAVLITSALMLGVYTIVKPAAEDGWGAGRDARRWARSRSRCWSRSSSARRPRANAADAAADLPLAQRQRRQPRSRRLSVAGMFGMFFLGSLYLAARARLRRRWRSAWRSCP